MKRRALTLVEVLAAAALLAVTVGALVPLLRDARDVGQADHSATKVFELSQAADEFMRDFTPEHARALASTPRRESWPDDPAAAPIMIAVEIRGGDESPRAWVVLECEGVAVARWLELPEPRP